MKIKNLFLSLLIFSFVFSAYNVGDMVSISDQNTSHSICNGEEPNGYNFSAYRGGDLFKVKLDIQGKQEYKTKF